jgi:hypothetical protein
MNPYNQIKNKRTKVNYRKIYEATFGPIPHDEFGRRYDIHHIDGDHNNNDISNLVALPITEHYKIHYDQKDWGACYFMAIRINTDTKEVAELARRYQLSLGENHPAKKYNRNAWKGEKNPSKTEKNRQANREYQLSLKENHPLRSTEYRKRQSEKMSGKNNIKFDPTIFVWHNLSTGEEVKMTKFDFCKTHNVPDWSVRRFLAGTYKNARGWIAIKE